MGQVQEDLLFAVAKLEKDFIFPCLEYGQSTSSGRNGKMKNFILDCSKKLMASNGKLEN